MRHPGRLSRTSARVDMTLLIGGCIAGIALSYYGIAVFLRWAKRSGICLDVPNERSSHRQATPRGAGLVIVVCTLGGLWILWGTVGPATAWRPLAFYTLGAVLIAAVSWFEDLHSTPRWIRFVAHVLGAACGIAGLGYWSSFSIPSLGSFNLGWAGAALTLFWIVGLTNAYNFMDGIDGIAGVQAVVAGIGWGVLGLVSGQPLTGGVGLLVASNSLGFLAHNWPPATVFMGDVGSLLLGFVFAGLVVRLSGNFLDFTCMASFLFLFYADVLTTMWIRFRDHEKLTDPHRRHLYQLLANEFGIAHWKVTMLYGAVQLMVGVSVISIRPYGLSAVLSLLTLYFIAFTLTNIHCRRKLMPI